MKKALIHFLLLSLFLSCENRNDELSGLVDSSGSIHFKVIDNGGNPINGAQIKLYNNFRYINYGDVIIYTPCYNSVGQSLVLSDSTDANGKCTIENLLADNYGYVVSYRKDNDIFYSGDYISITPGAKKSIVENPLENMGFIKFIITDTNKIPIEGFNVGIFRNPENKYTNINDLNYAINRCDYHKKTDSEGKVIFKLPRADQLNINNLVYDAIFYLDDSNKFIAGYTYCMGYYLTGYDTIGDSLFYNSKTEKFVWMYGKI